MSPESSPTLQHAKPVLGNYIIAGAQLLQQKPYIIESADQFKKAILSLMYLNCDSPQERHNLLHEKNAEHKMQYNILPFYNTSLELMWRSLTKLWDIQQFTRGTLNRIADKWSDIVLETFRCRVLTLALTSPHISTAQDLYDLVLMSESMTTPEDEHQLSAQDLISFIQREGTWRGWTPNFEERTTSERLQLLYESAQIARQ